MHGCGRKQAGIEGNLRYCRPDKRELSGARPRRERRRTFFMPIIRRSSVCRSSRSTASTTRLAKNSFSPLTCAADNSSCWSPVGIDHKLDRPRNCCRMPACCGVTACPRRMSQCRMRKSREASRWHATEATGRIESQAGDQESRGARTSLLFMEVMAHRTSMSRRAAGSSVAMSMDSSRAFATASRPAFRYAWMMFCGAAAAHCSTSSMPGLIST